MSRRELPLVRDLFEERDENDQGGELYPSLEAGLDAVSDGRKALIVETTLISDLDDGANLHLIAEALARGLSVILVNTEPQRPRERQWAHLYVLPLSEVWRIQARNLMLEIQKTLTGSTLEQEAFNSRILGYTDEQTRQWIARLKREQPALGAQTLFALLTQSQAAVVRQAGNRCLGVPDIIGDVEVVFAAHRLSLRPDAFDRVPSTHSLVRFGVSGDFLVRLLGPHIKEDIFTATLSGELLCDLNQSLRSNVEVFTPRGWEPR